MEYKDEDTKVFEIVETTKEENLNNDEIKKSKTSLKERWNSFSKKQKILIIALIILVVTLLIVAIIFLLKGNQEEEIKTKEEASIIIQNNNYRYEDGSLILLSENEEEIGRYECRNKDVEKCFVAYNSNEDDLDETKYIYEDGKTVSTQTPIINNKYVFIYDNNSNQDNVVILYDLLENKTVETYRLVKKAFNSDLYFIVANKEGKYGLIKIAEEGIAQVIKFNYDYLAIADKSVQDLGNVIAKSNDKYFIIDQNEKQLSKPVKEKIVGFNKNYIKVKNDDNLYTTYDYQGNKLLTNTYQYIYLSENYMGVVEDNKLFFIDNKENYLNIDGIKLPNSNYNKTYIYDKDDKMLEISNAAEISLEEKNIVVKINENDNEIVHNINILESIVNNKYSYISYIDGKLYFYSDEAKKTLIGSYPCKNKNNIVDENSTLDNCYLAKESSYQDNEMNAKQENLGYLPVINNRFVFINDTLNKESSSIVLYDLLENKTKSNYLSVDAGIYNNNSSLSFYDTENLNIIAVSAKKNKYGMINITKDNVTSFIEFTNNKIERMGNYYLVNKSSGTYSLIDNTQKYVTGDYSYKIVRYFKNYVKVLDNNKYRVFDFEEHIITTDAYDYIAMYEDNYAAIKDNKISVIKYNGEVLIKDVDLKMTDYENAYSVDSAGITIYNIDKTFEKIAFNNEENVNGEQEGQLNGEE